MFDCVAEAPASQAATSSHPSIDWFNGHDCDDGGEPRPRFVCCLGESLDLPDHWAPEMGHRGRTVPCGTQNGKPCPRCIPGVTNTRFSRYYPAVLSKNLKTLLAGKGWPVVWHVPGKHKNAPAGASGSLFEVFRAPAEGKQRVGVLHIEPLKQRVARPFPTFDVLPIVQAKFRILIPDLIIHRPTKPQAAQQQHEQQPSANSELAAMKAKVQAALSGIGGQPS